MEQKPYITRASLFVPQDHPADQWVTLEDLGTAVDIFLGDHNYGGGELRISVGSVEAVEAAALHLADAANLIRRARRDSPMQPLRPFDEVLHMAGLDMPDAS